MNISPYAALRREACANLRRNLEENPYPGRGIVVGLDSSGKNLALGYWIMGRSPNSRNRVFGREGGRVFTEAADPVKVEDPSLIIYNAMKESPANNSFDFAANVVSNGNQTDFVAQCYRTGVGFEEALVACTYEPDVPNFTPRITASCYWLHDVPMIRMAVLRKSPFGDECDRRFYHFNGIGPGFGYCITTYMGDGNPLPAFRGDPYVVPLDGDIHVVADVYWHALNRTNRVALAVKFIPKDGRPSDVAIINEYSKVG